MTKLNFMFLFLSIYPILSPTLSKIENFDHEEHCQTYCTFLFENVQSIRVDTRS